MTGPAATVAAAAPPIVLFSSGVGYNMMNSVSDLTAAAAMSPRFFKDNQTKKYFTTAATDLYEYLENGTMSPRLAFAMKNRFLPVMMPMGRGATKRRWRNSGPSSGISKARRKRQAWPRPHS